MIVRTLPVRWLGVLTLLAALTPIAGCQREPASSSSPAGAGSLTARPPLNFGGDFTLTNQDGQPFKLADVRGKPVLLFFGYTSCPDMCPMTMSRIMSARSLLGAQGESVVTLFVSVDPKRDTPTQLKQVRRQLQRAARRADRHRGRNQAGCSAIPRDI